MANTTSARRGGGGGATNSGARAMTGVARTT